MTFRYVHPKHKWFVDLPVQARSYLEENKTATVRILPDDGLYSVPDRCIEMHGLVVKRDRNWVVVSCDGLFASATTRNDDLVTGSPACVLVC